MRKVHDSESIYRRVPCNEGMVERFYKIRDGELIISSQAFTDREQCPSVNRSYFCNDDPSYSQNSPDDGVVSLICRQVREIDSVKYFPDNEQEIIYKMDVIWRPLADNEAHSQIEPSPSYRSKKTFRKLREKLAFLVNQKDWDIYPADFR